MTAAAHLVAVRLAEEAAAAGAVVKVSAYSLRDGSIVVMVRRDLVPHLIAYYLALLVLFVSAFNFFFLNAMNTIV